MKRTVQELLRDRADLPVQAFAPNPAFSLAPFALAAGTKVFKRNPSAAEVAAGVIDITNWLAISITPSANNLTRYFNGDVTKTRTIFGAQDTVIVLDIDVAVLTISGTDPSIEVEGM